MLFFEILSKLNWVDFIVITLLLRVCYISAKNGFITELFKLAGIIFMLYASLHYYASLADFLSVKILPLDALANFLDFICFIVLFFAAYLLIVFLRVSILHLVKMQAVPLLSKWGALGISFFRWLLAAGLLIFVFTISTIPYLDYSAKKSYSGGFLIDTAVSVYSGIWNGFMSRFAVGEEMNKSVIEAQQYFHQ